MSIYNLFNKPVLLPPVEPSLIVAVSPGACSISELAH
jgi:hypothetical protein